MRPRVSDLRRELAATREALALSEKLRKGLFTVFRCVEEDRDELRRQLAAAQAAAKPVGEEGKDGEL